MANKLPRPRIQSRHMRSKHLTRIDRNRSHQNVIPHDIVAMPMSNMCVETHVHNIPDCGVVDTHLKGWVIGVDVAVDLLFLLIRLGWGEWEQVNLQGRNSQQQ
jgi:hypothetical protein